MSTCRLKESRASRKTRHQGWIECTEVHWSVVQPRSATASTGGGHTAERAELRDVVFGKIADLASPILLQTCAMDKTIPKAKFEFMRADGDGKPVKYFEIQLENVLIGGVAPSLVAGTIQVQGSRRSMASHKPQTRLMLYFLLTTELI